jgi:threonine/homoserine/homoserine lactone efflux protein
MVQLITPQVDPVMASILQGASTSSPNPDAIRLWVKFFSQKLNSISPVSILDPWLSFFLFLLLQNPTFGWAKDFL